MRRNCALTPAQFHRATAGAAALALAVGLVMGALGHGPVLAFTLLEVAGLAVAVLLHGWHANDRECLTLQPGRLEVRHRRGGQAWCQSFAAAGLRIRQRHAEDLLWLSDGRQQARIGRHLAPHRRAALRRDLEQALRAAPGAWRPSPLPGMAIAAPSASAQGPTPP